MYSWLLKPKLLVFAPLLLLLLITVACGDEDTSTPRSTSTSRSPTATTIAQPPPVTDRSAMSMPDGKYGGTLHTQKHVNYGKLDPHVDVFDPNELPEIGVQYNGLLTYSEAPPTNVIIGDLARNWTLSGDGLTITFDLHDNAKWSDGQDVTADDVVFSLDRMVTEGETRPGTGLLRDYYASSTVVDPSTVNVSLKLVSGTVMTVLALENMKIVPKHVVEAGVDISVGENIVGSGPYKFVEYVTDDHITYEKNENYFKDGLPYLDGIKRFIIGDVGRIVAAFETEQVHSSTIGWTNLSLADYSQLQDDNSDKLTVHPLNDVVYFGMFINPGVSPLDNVKVRRALFVATDGNALNEAILGGKGQIHGPFAPWLSVAKTEEELRQIPGFRLTSAGEKDPQDIQMAKDLLADAGFAGGFDITLTFRQTASYGDQAAIIKEQLKAIDVNVELRGMESAAGFDAFGAGDFELGLLGTFSPFPDANPYLSQTWTPGGAYNYGNWSNAKFQQLFDDQAKAPSPEARGQILAQMQDILLNEDNPWIGLYLEPFFWVQNHQVKNWGPPITIGGSGLHWETAWLD